MKTTLTVAFSHVHATKTPLYLYNTLIHFPHSQFSRLALSPVCSSRSSPARHRCSPSVFIIGALQSTVASFVPSHGRHGLSSSLSPSVPPFPLCPLSYPAHPHHPPPSRPPSSAFPLPCVRFLYRTPSRSSPLSVRPPSWRCLSPVISRLSSVSNFKILKFYGQFLFQFCILKYDMQFCGQIVRD